MTLRIIACATILGCALGATSVMAAEARNPNLRSVVPVVNLRAPIPTGTTLSALMATNPGNISVSTVPKVAQGVRTKKDPTTDPTTYDDLTFTELNPCRILDSRVSQGGDGPFVNGVARTIKVGPYPAAGGGYSSGPGAQGGSATGCGLDTRASGGEVDAIMVAVSSFSQTGDGYLTFYSATSADPSTTVVSMFYHPGAIQTEFVVMPTDALNPSSSAGISRGANTEVVLDIIGYFAKPHAVALDCQTLADSTSVAAGDPFTIASPTCNTGFTAISALFFSSDQSNQVVTNTAIVDQPTVGQSVCQGTNGTAGAVTVACGVRCCRVPGR